MEGPAIPDLSDFEELFYEFLPQFDDSTIYYDMSNRTEDTNYLVVETVVIDDLISAIKSISDGEFKTRINTNTLGCGRTEFIAAMEKLLEKRSMDYCGGDYMVFSCFELICPE